VDSDPVSTHTGAMTEVAVKGPDVNETAAEWSAENAASDPAPPSDPVLTSAAAGTEVDVEGTDVSETAAMWSAAGVGHVFTFRVAFLLLRIKFMHSSFSQTGSCFFDRGLLLGIVLLAILVRMSVKCSMGSSKSSE